MTDLYYAAKKIAHEFLDVPDYIKSKILIEETNVHEQCVVIYLIDETGYEGYAETTTTELIHTALRMSVESHQEYSRL